MAAEEAEGAGKSVSAGIAEKQRHAEELSPWSERTHEEAARVARATRGRDRGKEPTASAQ